MCTETGGNRGGRRGDGGQRNKGVGGGELSDLQLGPPRHRLSKLNTEII